MNKLLLSAVLVLTTANASLAGKAGNLSYSDNAVSRNNNPVITKQESKYIEFRTDSCYGDGYTTDVRMMLVDTSNSAETIIKENIFLNNLSVNTIYSYTFDNYTERYLIMVSGICEQESFVDTLLSED